MTCGFDLEDSPQQGRVRDTYRGTGMNRVLLRLVFWTMVVAVVAVAPWWVIRGAGPLADWTGHSPDLIWTVAALLALPLLGAAMTIYDQVPARSDCTRSSQPHRRPRQT